MMREFLTLKTAPGTLLTTAQAKSHLNIDTSDYDSLLDGMILAATAMLDGAAGTLGRALLAQTWTLKRSSFANGKPCHFAGEIILPLAPLRQVNSVKYRDGTNTLQTLASDKWRTVNRGSLPSSVLPALNTYWPTTIWDSPEAVEIEFECGYGTASTDVPRPIIQAILLTVGHWFQNREAYSATDMKELPLGASALLSPYSINWFS